MIDLTPKFCPHCLVDFERDGVEIKTSNPPKCGSCLLPLWWEDWSGQQPDRPWPSYVKLLSLMPPRDTVYALIEESMVEALLRGASVQALPKDNGIFVALSAKAVERLKSQEVVPMILHCPLCHMRHVDKGEFATKLHHTHACQHCGMVWRPAVVLTVGVAFLPGFKDTAR